ncbi:MAG: hypothetical protein ACXWDL_13190, partial [Nocardioides sp.]
MHPGQQPHHDEREARGGEMRSWRGAHHASAKREGTEVRTRRASLATLPKAHLHLHFTGSMRHQTLLELAERDHIPLPDSLVGEWPPELSAADEKG